MKIHKMSDVYSVIICAALASTLFIAQAGASTLEFLMDVEYSDDGTDPRGSSPWASAIFTDKSPNTVTLTMSAANLVGSEFISVWLFNFDPTLKPDLLSFSAVGAQSSGPININTKANALKAGPSKFYDIKFDFPTSNRGSSNRFNSGESLIYDITYTGAGTINVSSFNFESTSDGGNGPYHSAMHIQSIGPDGDSGWIGNTTVIPEPISSVLFLSGAAALGFRRCWKKTS